MTFRIPYRIRAGIYIFTALFTPVVIYLKAKGIIGDLEVGLWSAEVTVASSMAAFNTSTPKQEK